MEIIQVYYVTTNNRSKISESTFPSLQSLRTFWFLTHIPCPETLVSSPSVRAFRRNNVAQALFLDDVVRVAIVGAKVHMIEACIALVAFDNLRL
jgi:hypothetical protein